MTLSQPLVPLVSDMDGTVTLSDSLHEMFFSVLSRDPWSALSATLPNLTRPQELKRQLYSHLGPEELSIPLRQEVVDFLMEESSRGRKIYLATGAVQEVAEQVRHRLPFPVEEVFSTSAKANLVGEAKADLLVSLFGERGFDYVGNSSKDAPIFRRARESILVAYPRHAHRDFHVSKEFVSKSSWIELLRGLRLHQWSKNLLVFVPLMAVGNTTLAQFGLSLLTFFVFGLLASGTYLINDIFDLQTDRLHASKKSRPLAAGRISHFQAIGASFTLISIAFLFSYLLSAALLVCFILYLLITVSYSLWAKKIKNLDVIVLGILYTFRIVAGGLVLNIAVSFWLLSLSFLLFTSLGMLKRFADGKASSFAHEREESKADRSYGSDALSLVGFAGVSLSASAILLLILYVHESVETGLRGQEKFLLVPVLAWWVLHIWTKASEGKIKGDPVLFALKNKGSRIAAFLIVIVWALPSTEFFWLS